MIDLNEGLRRNELDYLVLPLISIDEYKSKIDDRKAVVLGFYVTESDPAYDLATFIEKGVIPVLDTDVSPAPTTDGYYLVFVELERDDKLPSKVITMVKELGNITNVEDWQFSPYGSREKDKYDLTEDNIREHINLDPDSIEIEDSEDENDSKVEKESSDESMSEFFGDALFESAGISDGTVIISDNGCMHSYLMVKSSKDEPTAPIVMTTMDDPVMTESRKLQRMFGNAYEVYPTNEGILVANHEGYVILRSVD